ncbi:MAG: hypothetical protein O7H41_08375 [Planctomycetota bacterium]|nr:hypothetical protein [Planctomycetota bacterium]
MPKKVKWTEIDGEKAEALLADTTTPGGVRGVDPKFIPDTFLNSMTGVCSYYVSEAMVRQTLSDGKVVKGEFLLARDNPTLMKHNRYMFTESGQKVLFTALPHGFGHHWKLGKPVEVSSLFHHGPYPDK